MDEEKKASRFFSFLEVVAKKYERAPGEPRVVVIVDVKAAAQFFVEASENDLTWALGALRAATVRLEAQIAGIRSEDLATLELFTNATMKGKAN